MRKLTNHEMIELNREYGDVINPIVVEDFESACERSKQLCSKFFRQQRAKDRERLRTVNVNTINGDVRYRDDLIHGRVNPPCAADIRKYLAIMKRKHGGVLRYKLKKFEKGDKK